MLLPAAPQDWLPAGHLAHFINDTVDALELKAFYPRYGGGGSRNQPFHPAMMVKVLVHAHASGVPARARSNAGCTRIWRFGCWPPAASRHKAMSSGRMQQADLERGRSDVDDRRPAQHRRGQGGLPQAQAQVDRRAPNGWIKNVLGFRQFSMRGLHRVRAEWKLVCMALNLRRMATMAA